MTNVSWLDLGLYLVLYSFLGWVAEAFYYAVAKQRFYNKGVLSLPLLLPYGITFCLMILTLPSLGGYPVLQFLDTLVVMSVVESLSSHLMRRLSPRLHWGGERSRLFSGTGKGLLSSLLIAGVYYLLYLILHPVLLGLLLFIPPLVKRIAVLAALVLMALDFLTVLFALRRGDPELYRKRRQDSWQSKLGRKVHEMVWKRLRRAYPGIQQLSREEQEHYHFARGLCLDKLVWVFLIAALLGCVIEFFFCGLVDGQWMNRSSLLYGPFSFVWGLGAVVLTVTLQPLAKRNDRWVFLGGFVIGGAYEYLCSVFTELVFGTVFWDYSDMPLNIGGRTNVLFCFFWGILALLWVKLLYPPLSNVIERAPAIAGKAVTWVILFLMICNALLTSLAMLRYDSRAVRPVPANGFEAFLDTQYGDAYMESRWPNMIVTEKEAAS